MSVSIEKISKTEIIDTMCSAIHAPIISLPHSKGCYKSLKILFINDVEKTEAILLF